MQRKDITDLFPEATKEQIDKLMGINGNDINSAKGELTDLQTQLTAAQGEIQKLKDGAAGKPDELKEAKDAIAALTNELNGMKHADQVRQVREKVSGEKKVPANLLTGETEEACTAQADAILAFAKTGIGYPAVPDGGEAGEGGNVPTRQQFATWAKNFL